MRIGSRVVAVQQIAEPGFGVHAETGDEGEVVHVEDGIPTVRFESTGTATIVDPSEVREQDGVPVESV